MSSVTVLARNIGCLMRRIGLSQLRMERMFERCVVVAGNTIYRRDILLMRDISGIETGVARDAGKILVGGGIKNFFIDAEGNGLALFCHRERMIAMAGKTVSPGLGNRHLR